MARLFRSYGKVLTVNPIVSISGTSNHVINLSDSVSLADALLKTGKKNVTDGLILADSIVKKPSLIKTESISLSDALLRILDKNLTDTVTVLDTLISDQQGYYSPGTLANDNAVGTKAWSNASNAGTSDNSYATVVIDTGEVSNYLKATNYGFAIPNGATILGIKVEIEKKKTGGGTGALDNAVRIIKGGVIGSEDKSSGSEWSLSDTYSSYGGAADLWGETWAASDINNSGFGTAISGKETNGNVFTLSVDHIRITVYYQHRGASKSVTKASTDSQTLADALVKIVVFNKTDSVVIADNIDQEGVLTINISESFGITDSMLKTSGKRLTDSQTISDALIKTFKKAIQDSVTLADSLAKRMGLSKTESLVIADALGKVIRKSPTDTVAVIDSINKAIEINPNDSLGITDLVIRSITKSITDNLSLIDSIDIIGGTTGEAQRIYEVLPDRLKRKRGAFSNRSDMFKKKLF